MTSARSTVEEAPEEKFDEEAPAIFLCPITYQIMKKAVININGHTFEKAAIEEWYRKKGRDPITNLPVSSKILTPNRALQEAIDEWVKKHKVTTLSPEKKESKLPAVERKVSPPIENAPPSLSVALGPTSATYVPRLLASSASRSVSAHPGSLPSSPPLEMHRPESKAVASVEDWYEPELSDGEIEEWLSLPISTSNLGNVSSPARTPEQLDQAFLTAVQEGKVSEAKLLFSQGASLRSRLPSTGDTALIIATKKADKTMIQFLGHELTIAMTNDLNNQGDSALFFALQLEDNWFTGFLLGKGAFFHSYKHDGISLNSLGIARYGEETWDLLTRIGKMQSESLTAPTSGVSASMSISSLTSSVNMGHRSSSFTHLSVFGGVRGHTTSVPTVTPTQRASTGEEAWRNSLRSSR